MPVPISVAASVPTSATAAGRAGLRRRGCSSSELELDRAALAAAGFDGKAGQTLVVPRTAGPTLVAVGIGDRGQTRRAALRDAAAAFTRASATHERLAIDLSRTRGSVSPEDAARAVVEGVLLARYRYDPFHTQPIDRPARGADPGRR